MASPQRSRLKSVPCGSQSPPEQPLQVKVVGLFKSSTFQIAKSTAEVTAKKPQMPAALPASRLVVSGFDVRGRDVLAGLGQASLVGTQRVGEECGSAAGIPLQEGYL